MEFRAQERRRFCLCVLVLGERDICWGCGGLGVGFGVWWEEGRKGKVEGWMWVLMDLERGMMWRRSSYKVLVQISFDNEDTLGR